MNSTWVARLSACLGALVWIGGCAAGENADTGFGTAPITATTPATSAAASTGDPATTGSTSGESPTTGDGTTSASSTSMTTDATTDASTGTTTTDTTGTLTTDTTGDSSTGGGPACGNGVVEAPEACDDGNQIETDACLNDCTGAACGDGVVYMGIEECDDANAVDTDACLATCKAAKCGDGVVQAGVEACDNGVNDGAYDGCAVGCAKLGPKCGDQVVDAGFGETCDDGNQVAGDGCDASCKTEANCGNQGGGNLVAENGTGMNKFYCYNAGDSVDTRARKACESHFGVGQCCLIPNGYLGLQYGLCGADGGPGTVHFHPDSHPDGHCGPNYVVGDVVSPGWCGVILGNFLD